jgi:hypothetical protein
MPKDFERRLRAAETASAEANTCEVWIELRNGMMRGPRAEDAPPSAAGVGPGENGGGPWVRADRAPKPFFFGAACAQHENRGCVALRAYQLSAVR